MKSSGKKLIRVCSFYKDKSLRMLHHLHCQNISYFLRMEECDNRGNGVYESFYFLYTLYILCKIYNMKHRLSFLYTLLKVINIKITKKVFFVHNFTAFR